MPPPASTIAIVFAGDDATAMPPAPAWMPPLARVVSTPRTPWVGVRRVVARVCWGVNVVPRTPPL
jgi:hypothetical protein